MLGAGSGQQKHEIRVTLFSKDKTFKFSYTTKVLELFFKCKNLKITRDYCKVLLI